MLLEKIQKVRLELAVHSRLAFEGHPLAQVVMTLF